MNGCGKYENALARYIHGERMLPDREELEKHLAVCPDCERLYREVVDLDQVLRDLPGKLEDPPPYLHARIVASLREEEGESSLRTWWRGWAVAATAAAGLLALAIGLHRGEGRIDRTALAPAARPAAPPTGAQVAPRQAGEEKPPVLSAAPERGKSRSSGTAVASAPKIEVIHEVKIFFHSPPARQVAVTGDFNNWDTEGVPMKASGKPGLWETELRLPPGVYSYNFIVDGELLLPDPNATNQMPDGYGGTNSILLVQGDTAI